MNLNSPYVSAQYRVFDTLIHTKKEGVGVGLKDFFKWGFPFSCCEAAKDEVVCRLYDRNRPTFFIAATMEILGAPAILNRIINLLKLSARKLISNELLDHFTMLRGTKSRRIPEKIFGF